MSKKCETIQLYRWLLLSKIIKSYEEKWGVENLPPQFTLKNP